MLEIKNLSIDFFGKELRNNLKLATQEDPLLQSVLQAVKTGWKELNNSKPLEHFKRRAQDLTIVDDTLLLGDRIVIPEKLKPAILAVLHKGHPGIRRSKQLAREYVYWPKMSEDIEHLVRQCDACAINQKLPVKVPLDPWPIPSRPMERVHMDYAEAANGHYLLIFVDAYTKFIDVATTSTITTNRTIDLCRKIFSRYGPPDILVTDHGTQFTSGQFAAFCKEMQSTHLLSSVNHPQSNGQAERMVDTVKRAIAKDPDHWKKQLLDFLYSYRYTPCSASPEGKSPAELFFGRRMNSPFTKWLPKPDTNQGPIDPADDKQLAMKEQFTRHHGARPRELMVGDRVIVLARKDKREQGVISGTLSKTRYSVRLNNGKTIDRHINHIWKGGSAPVPSESSDDGYMFSQPHTPPTPRRDFPTGSKNYLRNPGSGRPRHRTGHNSANSGQARP